MLGGDPGDAPQHRVRRLGSAVNMLRPSTISASQSSAGSRTASAAVRASRSAFATSPAPYAASAMSTMERGSSGRPGVLDVPTGVGPPSGDDRGAGEPQAQLRAFRTAQAVDDGLAGFEGLHRAAEQGEHVHALGGRGVLARLVEEGGGAAHGAAAHVRAGQLDEVSSAPRAGSPDSR